MGEGNDLKIEQKGGLSLNIEMNGSTGEMENGIKRMGEMNERE